MNRLLRCVISLALLGASFGYVFTHFSLNLGWQGSRRLIFAICLGIWALISFAYSAVNPAVRHRATRVLVGLGALVATFCSGALLIQICSDRALLQHSGVFPMFAFISFLALAVTLLAWVVFWRCEW